MKQFDPRKMVNEDGIARFKRLRERISELVDEKYEDESLSIGKSRDEIYGYCSDYNTLIDEMIESMEMQLLALEQKN